MAAQYALAQGEQATVYLNNGSILNGLLAKSNTENKYRMRIPNGSVIFFNGNEVASILRNSNTPMSDVTNMAGETGTAYLNNGSIIKGKLRKSGNSDKYRAVFPNGSIFFFSENFLRSIEYEQVDDWGDGGNGNVLAQAPKEGFTGSVKAKPGFRSDLELDIWYRRGSSRANAGRTLFFVGLGCAVGGAALLFTNNEGTQVAGLIIGGGVAPLFNRPLPIV
ncbi:hypothetical protein FACS1894181_14640 [Bacteroidia bacterium]|nr:hypothetical protein FACS1894181_14640 [Bacteroidia bacterium]